MPVSKFERAQRQKFLSVNRLLKYAELHSSRELDKEAPEREGAFLRPSSLQLPRSQSEPLEFSAAALSLPPVSQSILSEPDLAFGTQAHPADFRRHFGDPGPSQPQPSPARQTASAATSPPLYFSVQAGRPVASQHTEAELPPHPPPTVPPPLLSALPPAQQQPTCCAPPQQCAGGQGWGESEPRRSVTERPMPMPDCPHRAARLEAAGYEQGNAATAALYQANAMAGTPGGFPALEANGTLRGILRKAETPQHASLPSLNPLPPSHSNSQETLQLPLRKKLEEREAGGGGEGEGDVCGRYVRPLVAELLAVAFSTFVGALVEAGLAEDAGLSPLTRVGVVSLVEAALASTFLLSFHGVRVQLCPALSLSALFAGSAPPLLCLLNIVVQLLAATGAACGFKLLAVQQRLPLPTVPPSQAWILSVYRLVVGQTLCWAMLVLVYLSGGDQGDPQANLGTGGVPAAVGVATLVSLLSSTASWNPLRSLASLLATWLIDGDASLLALHYVFWLGPLIGSLFASFIHRLAFAGPSKRFLACGSD